MSLKDDCGVPAQKCTGFYLRRAARAVARLYDRHLAKADMKGTQFTLLNAVFLQSPVTVNELAESLAMDRTTLTRNLKRLESKGWLEAASGEDRRTRWINISSEGKKKLKLALPHWKKAQQETESILGKTGIKNLRTNLKKLESLET